MGISISTGSRGGIVGKIIFSGFGLFFAVFGCFFVAMAWNAMLEAKAMQKWIDTPCTIISTETSGSGKNRSTRTVKTPLHTHTLLETESQSEIARGTLQFAIPEDQPPSEPGNDGGIRWQLLFHGDIARWPDLREELSFTVYPAD